MKASGWILGIAAGLVVTLGGLALGLRAAVAPLPGEWSIPLRLGPFTVDAGVPTLVRLATSPWAGPLLDGRRWPVRGGTLETRWHDGQLSLHCAPCRLRLPALGPEPLVLPAATFTVRRLGEDVAGELTAGAVRGQWRGRLGRETVRLDVTIPTTPIADLYALFDAAIPEVRRATIEGVFSLRAQVSLPAGTATLQPAVSGFAVSGLGTESLRGAAGGCPRPARLDSDSWIARAVVAAEDQRFFEHPGYDLRELVDAVARNQDAGHIARGGSTLGQQLAKLLVTGDERSPVRKLRELLYAVEMESALGKARILRLYLDHVPWGQGLCGAEAAARHYFGLPAHRLDPARAVWLAAMLHQPDAHAARWSTTGTIDRARAQRIALHLRGLGPAARLRLAASIEQADWTPHWAARAEGTAPVSGQSANGHPPAAGAQRPAPALRPAPRASAPAG